MHPTREIDSIFARRVAHANRWLVTVALITVVTISHVLDADVFLLRLVVWLSVVTIAWNAVGISRKNGDHFSPHNLLIGVAAVRYLLPLVIVETYGVDVPLFELMGLGEPVHWYRAALLTCAAILSFQLPWLFTGSPPIGKSSKSFRFLEPKSPVVICAWGFLVLGFAAVTAFVIGNASISAVIVEGVFRKTEIRAGTGPLLYLGLAAMPASVVLSIAYLRQGRGFLLAALPVLSFFLLFAALGGRARAMTPLLVVLWAYWYLVKNASVTPGEILRMAAFGSALFIIFLVIGQFRAGLGLGAIEYLSSQENLAEVIVGAILVELGQLHSIAGATILGPGLLEGRSFAVFLWPLSEVFPAAGQSAGLFIAEELIGFDSGRTWAFHASLIGDAFLNSGMALVVICGLLLGKIIHWIYGRMMRGVIPIEGALLVIFFVLRIFFESTGKYPELVTIIGFFLAIRFVAATLFARSS